MIEAGSGFRSKEPHIVIESKITGRCLRDQGRLLKFPTEARAVRWLENHHMSTHGYIIRKEVNDDSHSS